MTTAKNQASPLTEPWLIYSLISKVMADVGSIGKGRTNEMQKYKFRGIEDMYNAVHPALIKHGVFCAPEVLTLDSTDFISKNGTPSYRVILKVNHKFYAPDGSSISVITIGEGIDTSDKACNKAMSAAMKYAFIELFSIPTEDIADSDKSSPEAGIRPGQPGPEDGNTDPMARGYKIPFGKYAQRTLEEIDLRDLGNYINYIQDKAVKDKKPIQGAVLDFVNRATDYIAAIENMPLGGTSEDEPMSFVDAPSGPLATKGIIQKRPEDQRPAPLKDFADPPKKWEPRT